MKPAKASALILLAIQFSLLAPIVHAETPVKALLAQCTIESYGDSGRRFLEENDSANDRDKAFRNWMLICMEAKGFAYDLKVCPLTQDGASNSSDPGCYKRM